MQNSKGMNHKSTHILYEDDDIMVINKPAGLVVHSDGRTAEPTVVDWILTHRPDIRGVGDENESGSKNYELKGSNKSKGSLHNSEFILHNSSADLRSGIVHRLDRETSGALIIAKNQETFLSFKRQFKKQEVHKTYHAFVYGRMKNDDGLINRPIARSRANPVLWSATRGRKGEDREAVTEYKVLARLTLPYQGEYSDSYRRRGVNESRNDSFFTLLELYPRTGRTHQLRVHLKAINYPIVADKLYSKNEQALGFNRLALHSRAISFLLANGKRITVEAPYPEDFEKALKIFWKHQ